MANRPRGSFGFVMFFRGLAHRFADLAARGLCRIDEIRGRGRHSLAKIDRGGLRCIDGLDCGLLDLRSCGFLSRP